MKRLKFSEFFVLPAGVLFSLDFALPHRYPGLWTKGESYPDDEDEMGRAVAFCDVLDDAAIYDVAYEDADTDEDEDGRRFLVFEAGDLGRLAGIIAKARLLAERI